MTQMFDLLFDSSSLRFGMDFLGMSSTATCHTHVVPLCHIAYGGHVYGGRPESLLNQPRWDGPRYRGYAMASSGVACFWTSRAAWRSMVGAGRSCHEGRPRAAEKAEGGARRRRHPGFQDRSPPRRLERVPGTTATPVRARPGCTSTRFPGCTAADRGFYRWGRRNVPSTDDDTLSHPPLQIVAMGMLASDSLNLEACVGLRRGKAMGFMVG